MKYIIYLITYISWSFDTKAKFSHGNKFGYITKSYNACKIVLVDLQRRISLKRSLDNQFDVILFQLVATALAIFDLLKDFF